ncbi:MAG: noncanonical pyrimidine nucleotidase, YjjG family [Cytophagales bacterium]|nr:noncanonical pyrimidine nucleotidase, YjjG family [Cytophagales bacterium]
MSKYRHLFFDLDHTLWDFDRNSDEALHELCQRHELQDIQPFNLALLQRTFKTVNEELWELLDKHQISVGDVRKTRFRLVFERMGIPNFPLPAGLEEEYLELCPQGQAVIPFAHETLQYLQQRYQLHIITNGYQHMQVQKMSHAGLLPYFDELVTVDLSGYRKPSPQIFEYALSRTGARLEQSLMIGDNPETDIRGAQSAGLDQVYFNPQRKAHQLRPTYEISSLSELMEIL